MKDYIITVMAPDRVGIVRDVSTALTSVGGNITHLSQTVLRNYFTLIISAEMPDERTHAEIRQAIERNGDVGELEVIVRPYKEMPCSQPSECQCFTLSMQGTDQKGIIARTTTYLADCGINVDDFYSYVYEEKLLMLAQVSVPDTVDIEVVQDGLRRVGGDYDLIVHFQHIDIFRATGDVRSVLDIQRRPI